MAKIGRPTKLTQEVQDQLCLYLKTGMYIEPACDLVGIERKTFYNWLKRGKRAKSGIYAKFLHTIKKAIAESEMRDVNTIREASKQSWQASAWRLERRFPERWGSKQKIDNRVTVKGVKNFEFIEVNSETSKVDTTVIDDSKDA